MGNIHDHFDSSFIYLYGYWSGFVPHFTVFWLIIKQINIIIIYYLNLNLNYYREATREVKKNVP